MNKKIIAGIIVIAIGVFGVYFAFVASEKNTQKITSFEACAEAGYPVGESYPRQCFGPNGKTFVEEIQNNLKIISDEENGVRFQYPTTLETTYIELLDWPPKIQVLNTMFDCIEAGNTTDRAGKTELKTIGGHEYCVTTIVEGAAGSTYTQYAYAFIKEDKTAIVTFSTRAPQCENYDDERRNICETEQALFDIDTVVNQIAETMVLLPK